MKKYKQTKVEVGEVSYINMAAFMNSGITAFVFPTNALEVVANYAFFGCSSLTQFGQTPGALISENLRYIGQAAFYETGFDEVDLASTSLLLLNNSFNGSQVKNFKANATTVYQDAFFRSKIETLELPNIKVLNSKALAGMWSLQTLKLGPGLESIGDYLFYDDLLTYTTCNHHQTDIWFDGPLPAALVTSQSPTPFFYTDKSNSPLYLTLFNFKSVHVPSANLSEYKSYFQNIRYDSTALNNVVAQ